LPGWRESCTIGGQMSTSDTSGARVRGGGRGKRGTEESVSAPRRKALLIGLSVFLFLALLSPLVATARGSTLSQAQKDLNAAQAALGRFQDSMNVLAASTPRPKRAKPLSTTP